MATSIQRAAEFTVELPPEQAMELFTPEGERLWADGWDPQYSEAGRRGGPGTVFATAHGDVGSGPNATQVRVTYELTALTANGESWLDSFDAAYDDFIASWATAIAALKPSGPAELPGSTS